MFRTGAWSRKESALPTGSIRPFSSVDSSSWNARGKEVRGQKVRVKHTSTGDIIMTSI